MKFIKPAGTSRGVLTKKDSYFIILRDMDAPGKFGIGECSLIPELSFDNVEIFEAQLKRVCRQITSGEVGLDVEFPDFPAIQFGLETALTDLQNGGNRILFPSDFTMGKKGILINGLIWMDSKQGMLKQIEGKLAAGFTILKMKVGALNFKDELELLQMIREKWKEQKLEIRLDANGAWKREEAIEKLNLISAYRIHSIEQPIRPGFPEDMAEICETSPIPVALDEELIGISSRDKKEEILATIKPAYIILKPSLLGGISASETWIQLAEKLGIGWWVTSALESNIGLNAIAQWTATLNTTQPQGLGTGSLFANNLPSPLTVTGSRLIYRPEKSWNLSSLKF
ncbi:MAG: o-succinylbenzoate synthase [Bacteroidales bacterium]